MTRKQAVITARKLLAEAGIEDASLEAEILLMHTLQIDRVTLYQDSARELSSEEEKNYLQAVERRRRGEPSPYITGNREFYGLDFYVDKRVLIPRPESELLVDQALKCAQNMTARVIADIGTGSGAMSISIALKLPYAIIYATDVSADALEVAKINCLKHGVAGRVYLLQGDLLSPLPEPVDIIVANLPYVTRADIPGVTTSAYEPVLALDGGPEGTEKIFRLCRQARKKLKESGCLLLEIGMGQASAVTGYLRNIYPSGSFDVLPDLSGIDRVVRFMPKPDVVVKRKCHPKC